MDEEKQMNLDEPELYINRELSMLTFQERVLEEALDESNPLLERIKFISILGSNLDEFFMVRVGGLRMQINAGITKPSPDGLTPAEQLAEIRKRALQLMVQARDHLRGVLLPLLNDAGIHVLEYHELTQKQQENTKEYFNEIIFPVLTPLAFDPGHPFPHISNLSLNLAVLIRDESRRPYRDLFPSSALPVESDGMVPFHTTTISSGSSK
jgi:polyphosphate kinase